MLMGLTGQANHTPASAGRITRKELFGVQVLKCNMREFGTGYQFCMILGRCTKQHSVASPYREDDDQSVYGCPSNGLRIVITWKKHNISHHCTRPSLKPLLLRDYTLAQRYAQRVPCILHDIMYPKLATGETVLPHHQTWISIIASC